MMNNTTQKFARDFRADARAALKDNWLMAIVITFVAGLLGAQSGIPSLATFNLNIDLPVEEWLNGSAPLPSIETAPQLEEMLGTLWVGLAMLLPILSILSLFSLILFLIGPCIQLGLCRFHLSLLDGEGAQAGLLFSGFKDMFFKALGLNIVQGLLVTLWIMAFFVPGVIGGVIVGIFTESYGLVTLIVGGCYVAGICAGIIASYRYSMAFYALSENSAMTVMDTLRESKRMMVGNKWRLFCLQFSFIGWSILCLFTCGIGYFVLSPYTMQAQTAFYHEVSGRAAIRQTLDELDPLMQDL